MLGLVLLVFAFTGISEAEAVSSWQQYLLGELSSIENDLAAFIPYVRGVFGEAGLADLQGIRLRVAELSREVAQDTPPRPLTDLRPDVASWNAWVKVVDVLSNQTGTAYGIQRFGFASYVYRRVVEAVDFSQYLRTMDPYRLSKRKAFSWARPFVSVLLHQLRGALHDHEISNNASALRNTLRNFLQESMWSNGCDLSTEDISDTCRLVSPEDPSGVILVDEVNSLLDILEQAGRLGTVNLTIVTDNAGFELFSDLVLIELLLATGSVDSVTLHVKPMPWYVSDVTIDDVQWMARKLLTSGDCREEDFGRTIHSRLEQEQLKIRTHDFWSLPYSYNSMKDLAPDLYAELSEAELVIFKGQLNLIKLIQGYRWNLTTPFHEALDGFNPAPLCSLVTLKLPTLVDVDPSGDELQGIEEILLHFHVGGGGPVQYASILCDPHVTYT